MNDALCVLKDFRFGDISDPLALAAGTYNIKIGLANVDNPCSEPAVLEADVPFESGENATVIAHLTEDGGITATKFTNDLSPLDKNQARLVVRHTAAAPAVDILAQSTCKKGPELLIEDLSNPNGAQADVPAGSYKVSIYPAGSDTPVFGPVRLTLRAQVAHFVYAVGSLDSGSFTLIKHRIWRLH